VTTVAEGVNTPISEALVEEIAATMWESRRDGVMESRVWANAGEYWQKPFREMARGVAEPAAGGWADATRPP
jgi:hypothetical protein